MNRNVPWRTTRGGRMLALSQGHNDWYRIRNQATGPAQLHIYDEIGFFGVTANDLISELADVTGPLDVHLNSPGGEVNDGLAIYNCLLARDGVSIFIDGIAASIASVIAMAGDTVNIAATAQIMVHNPFTGVIGDAKDLRAVADRLDENKRNIATIYSQRTGLPESHWMEVMDNEGWYRGKEAVDAKLADNVIAVRGKGAAAAKDHFDMSIYNTATTTTGSGAATVTSYTIRSAAHHPYHSHTEPMHEPVTGMHSHNHAAFGCEDADDGMHAHSHVHNGDAQHGHTHMMHGHDHQHEHPHHHAHELGEGETYGTHHHRHAHHAGFDPDHDGDDDSTAKGDTDHDYVLPNGKPGPKAVRSAGAYDIFAKDKYTQAERDAMAKSGEAMADGSYPIKDREDLSNAIHAVGRGKNNSHEAIRRHVIKRARALKLESMIPDDWSEGGSSAGSSDAAPGNIIYNDADAAALLSALR